ncbi:MAG TPA: nitrite/sulfite reductase [Candidatus Methylomirabilis sp.]|nr:nitrite/sulfite reductase [Candidatus Methylomirabilis sp.]
MDIAEDHRTLGRTRLSFASTEEIDDFVATLERFERGELSADQWRAYRLVRGTYGQRQAGDAQMLRVKIPQGILDAEQLRALADVARDHSRGFAHITTRQNLQLHFVKLHDVEHAMRRLAAAGLTTREACGNSVRNITACPSAGVAADEAFDVTPYAEALTRYLLRHPLSSALPRKFKIAFEGCGEDHAVTAINDIGWRARVRIVDGVAVRGFRVTVGGGTAILCRSGDELCDFLPAGALLEVAEAILRVFHRLGDYEHKHRNRMKFLIRALGFERWRAEFEKSLREVRDEGGVALPFDPAAPPVDRAPDWPRPPAPSPAEVARRAAAAVVRGPGITPLVRPALAGPGDFARWRTTNVRRQKQEDYAVATATVPLGDLTGAQLEVLADLSLAYGEGAVRVTHNQDLMLRWVREADLGELYRRLAAAGLGLPDANTLADVTSCPGAEACRLAVTQSRGLGRLLTDFLRERPDLVAAAPGLDVKISGCPNGCGQHHIAGIGFQGSIRKVGEKIAPQYFVMVGGGAGGDRASFGRLAAKVPARRIPAAVERLIGLYTAEREEAESAADFFRRVDLARVKALLADLEALSPESAGADDFVDLGEDAEFRVETQEGECVA